MESAIDNIVVDSASIEVNRRARRAKTDRLDGDKLLAMLIRYHAGERRVWSVLGTACADPDNALPESLRAAIISLSIWVGKHTSEVIRRKEEIEPLIEVNRMIMQGLRGDGRAAAA